MQPTTMIMITVMIMQLGREAGNYWKIVLRMRSSSWKRTGRCLLRSMMKSSSLWRLRSNKSLLSLKQNPDAFEFPLQSMTESLFRRRNFQMGMATELLFC